MSNNLPEQPDHFNWPTPQRKDLMSNTQNSIKDITSLRKLRQQQKSNSLNTSDIQGAQPFTMNSRFLNKQSFINKCDDINEKKNNLSVDQGRENFVLKIDDIQGTKPQKVKFITNRVVNPLEPAYKLPSFQYVPIEIPKFLRDNINIRDIEGARAKKDPWQNKIRNVDPYTEIEGSKPRRTFYKKNYVDSLQVQDIIKDGIPVYNKPPYNPLQPQYLYQHEENKPASFYGQIDKNQPRIRHPDLQKEKSFSLHTRDIQGCWANSLREKLQQQQRIEYHKINKIDDITGAQPSTLKRGLQTNRCVNPLFPTYCLPGAQEIIQQKQLLKTNTGYNNNNNNISMIVQSKSEHNTIDNQRNNMSFDISHTANRQQQQEINANTNCILKEINLQNTTSNHIKQETNEQKLDKYITK